MTTRRRWLLAAVALTLCLTVAPQAQVSDLAGVYVCEGTNGDSDTYRGTVEVQTHGDTWHLAWAFEGGETGEGVGVLEGAVLAVIFRTSSGAIGVAAYRVERTGDGLKLVGRWTMPGAPILATETLTRTRVQTPAQLRGPSRGV